MLLSFLYREGCWALVSVTNGKGGSCMGILRPFTVFAALLSVLGDPHGACGFGEANVGQYIRVVDDEICKSECKFNKEEDLLDSQVYDQFEADLFEVYYAMEAEINPKLEASRIQEDAVLDFRSETSETFFSNLADRINRGIESEVVDMGVLAERLVNSSIYYY
ncbi:hypothetical protein E2542_SST09258 [Spatholobus suberectus]|nr:hypothetical protein E2542_SST09258 [Spatholobus suberectus]